MTDIGELVAVAFLQSQVDEKCPFELELLGPSGEEGEEIEEDDLDEVQAQQENDGGTLGKNLTSGSPGDSGTIGGPYTAKKRKSEPAQDTKRTKGAKMIFVKGTDQIEQGEYPIHQAAHHLIPGVAALENSYLWPYMLKDGEVTTENGKKYTVQCHIGYNVNGSHNGIWLPGNYAIRGKGDHKKTPVSGKNWAALNSSHPDWQMNYAAAVSKVSGAQFHDTHTKYNDAVEKLLNKIATVLWAHQESGCEDCKDKTEISPPYLVKERLYNISTYLKTNLTGHPYVWKRPWITSDRWRDAAFLGGEIKDEFLSAYNEAREP